MLPGFHSHVSRVISVGRIEAISTLLLFFVAMPMKYFADKPLAVTIVGSIHGGLFILLAVVTYVAWIKKSLSFQQSCLVAVGAIFPFGPFIVERWLPQEASPLPSSPPTAPDGDDVAAGEG